MTDAALRPRDAWATLATLVRHPFTLWRAGLRAVEGGAAAPHPLLVIQDVEAHLTALVAAVEDEAMCVHDRGRAEVLPIRPEHRAARGACGAQDALGGVIEDGSLRH